MGRAKRRIDNKGMTLVELLLAVTILAIIVVPLLHAFVSSARINRKSRITAKLTTVGQDIMEGLKAYSIEDLAYEFDYPKDGCPEHNRFELINRSMIGNDDAVGANVKELKYDASTNKYSVCNASEKSIQENVVGGSTERVFKDIPGKKYYYAITNVSSETSSSSSYKADILIKLDPVKYTSAGTVSNNEAMHNDKNLADITSMDTSKDAFYLEAGTQFNNAFMQLAGMGASVSDAEDINKKIEVTVSNDGSNVKVLYQFTYISGTHSVTYPSNPDLSALKFNTLENVYLFYLPSYNSVGDEIIYTNTTGRDVNFNLIKRQITQADGLIPTYYVDDFSILNTKENTYKCLVTINDSNNKTKLRTNVKTNLAALVPDPSNPLTGDDILKDNLSDMNVRFVYNVGGGSPTRESVVGDIEEDRIYDVTIEIYEAGTINNASLGGSLPEDKRLASLKGNMK